jgi:GH35 family endo-1,4-beta-xylanase
MKTFIYQQILLRKHIIVLCSLLSINIVVHAQATMPTGQSWKDIAPPGTAIGSYITSDFVLPLNSTEQWKKNHRDVFLRECNLATIPSFPFITWTAKDQYDFTNFNALTNWLKDNNKQVMAHLLIGADHYNADWFQNGTFTKVGLDTMMENFIKNIITSNDNANKVDIWNVVNEALHGDKPIGASYYYRGTKWLGLDYEADQSGLTGAQQVIKQHPVYVRRAFELARKYTTKKLEYRDNNCEWGNTRHYDEVYQLMLHLKKSGVPVDAFGMQTHLNLSEGYRSKNDALEYEYGYDWESFKNQVKRMKALGLEVYVSEIDVRGSSKSAEDFEKQRLIYYKCVKACVESGVKVINFWGLRDGSMANSGDGQNANPFAESATYDAKPAYYGIQQALAEFAVTLSLQQITLNATQYSNNNHLQLQTKNEINTKDIIIEYSTNGINFTSLTQLQTLGNGNKQYSFYDYGFTNGTTLWYRAKLVQQNGSLIYSNIVRLGNNSNTSISLYPNPSSQFINVINNSTNYINTVATIINSKGITVKTINITSQITAIDIADLPNGMYYIKTNNIVQKFVKQ